MSNNLNSTIEREKNKIDPFDKIEQGTKKYIPNIPSVISDMKKNNIYNEGISNDESKEKLLNNNDIKSSSNENNNNEQSKENIINNETNYLAIVCDYWNTFRNNDTVSTIINPFQDDGECVNKVYKIYSCITITLILIVILLSITLS